MERPCTTLKMAVNIEKQRKKANRRKKLFRKPAHCQGKMGRPDTTLKMRSIAFHFSADGNMVTGCDLTRGINIGKLKFHLANPMLTRKNGARPRYLKNAQQYRENDEKK